MRDTQQQFREIIQEVIEPIRERHWVFPSEIEKFTNDLWSELNKRMTFEVPLGKGRVAICCGIIHRKGDSKKYLSFGLTDEEHEIGSEVPLDSPELPLDDSKAQVYITCPTKQCALVLQQAVNNLVESFDEDRSNPERQPGKRESDSSAYEPMGVGAVLEGAPE